MLKSYGQNLLAETSSHHADRVRHVVLMAQTGCSETRKALKLKEAPEQPAGMSQHRLHVAIPAAAAAVGRNGGHLPSLKPAQHHETSCWLCLVVKNCRGMVKGNYYTVLFDSNGFFPVSNMQAGKSGSCDRKQRRIETAPGRAAAWLSAILFSLLAHENSCCPVSASLPSQHDTPPHIYPCLQHLQFLPMYNEKPCYSWCPVSGPMQGHPQVLYMSGGAVY